MFLGQGEEKETARETGALAPQHPEPGRDPGSPAFLNTAGHFLRAFSAL